MNIWKSNLASNCGIKNASDRDLTWGRRRHDAQNDSLTVVHSERGLPDMFPQDHWEKCVQYQQEYYEED